MCGRYTIATDAEALAARFHAEVPASLVSPSYNAAPSQSLPVILSAHPQTITVRAWRFLPAWTDGVTSNPSSMPGRKRWPRPPFSARPSRPNARTSIMISQSTEMVELTMALFATFQVNGHQYELLSLRT